MKIIRITSKQLKLAMSVRFAAAGEKNSRYDFTGVLFSVCDNSMECIATDGRRLARMSVPLLERTDTFSFVLPARSLNVWDACTSGRSFPLELEVDDQQASLDSALGHVSVNLLKVDFPPVDRIIPRMFTREVRVQRDEAIRAVKQAAIFSTLETRASVFTFEHHECRINSVSQGVAVDCSVVFLKCEWEGPRFSINCNVDFLLEGLSKMTKDTIMWQFTSDLDSPMLLLGGMDYVLMPVTIGSNRYQ